MQKSSSEAEGSKASHETGAVGSTDAGPELAPGHGGSDSDAPVGDPIARQFLAFNYPELKDLGKHFLTLSSATAVFLLTFVDKLVGPTASPSSLIKACLLSLLISMASAGTGLFVNYIAGSGASGAIIWGVGKVRFRALTIGTYLLYMLAGSALFLAYALLAYATLSR